MLRVVSAKGREPGGSTGPEEAEKRGEGASARPERILCMDAAVADQIAAGEVIERPASALKELLDNAIDAGARRIEIDIEGGGAEKLRVWDDGRGIHAEDLPLAILRHATSKLRRADDLLSVATLGFRGEALASLAAVAHLRIRSRPEHSELGQELVAHPGQAPQQCALGMPKGTQVEVSALFAQIPARKKFLRAEATEVAHCVDAVLKIALLHPHIAFVLRNGRRTLLSFAVHDKRRRVEAILGRRAKGPFLGFEGEVDGTRIWGLAAPAQQAIRQSQGLYFAVRKRVIRDRNCSRIVNRAFGEELAPGRYPVAFVELDPPAQSVDINVHPQKSEVRFSDAQRVYAALREVVTRELVPQLRPSSASSLDKENDVDSVQVIAEKRREVAIEGGEAKPGADDASRLRLQALVEKGLQNAQNRGEGGGGARYRLSTRAQGPGYEKKKAAMKREVQALRSVLQKGMELERTGNLFRDEPGAAETKPARVPKRVGPSDDETQAEGQPSFAAGAELAAGQADFEAKPSAAPGSEINYLTMLAGLRALFEVDGALWVVELRRLRSYLVEQKLRRQWGDAQTIGVQQLLKAVVLRPPADTLDLCLRHRKTLLRVGIDVEAFGPGVLRVRGVPAALGVQVEEAAILRMLEQLRPWLKLQAMDGDNERDKGDELDKENEGAQKVFAAVAELAPVESTPRAAPRLARRWLQEALAEAQAAQIPGISIWSGEQLCRG